jgi:hypothetical protein
MLEIGRPQISLHIINAPGNDILTTVRKYCAAEGGLLGRLFTARMRRFYFYPQRPPSLNRIQVSNPFV